MSCIDCGWDSGQRPLSPDCSRCEEMTSRLTLDVVQWISGLIDTRIQQAIDQEIRRHENYFDHQRKDSY